MARVFTFLIILAGMSVILTYAGIQTGSSLLLNSIGFLDSSQDVQGSSFFSTISLIFTVGAAASIIIGIFVRQSSESIIVSSLSLLLLVFVSDFVSLYSYLANNYPDSWVRYVIAPILFSMLVGYAISIVSFWRGSD